MASAFVLDSAFAFQQADVSLLNAAASKHINGRTTSSALVDVKFEHTLFVKVGSSRQRGEGVTTFRGGGPTRACPGEEIA